MNLLLGLLASTVICSCDSEKARADKAQSLISEFLNKELPDFDSYEVVSTELDSLPDNLLFCDTILHGIDDLMTAYNDINVSYYNKVGLENEIETIRENVKRRFTRNFWSGNEWLLTPENFQDTERIEQLQQEISTLDSEISSKKRHVDKMAVDLQKLIKENLDTVNFTGYSVCHKFRAKDTSGNMQLDTRFFIIDKDFKKITPIAEDEDKFPSSVLRQILSLDSANNSFSDFFEWPDVETEISE